LNNKKEREDKKMKKLLASLLLAFIFGVAPTNIFAMVMDEEIYLEEGEVGITAIMDENDLDRKQVEPGSGIDSVAPDYDPDYDRPTSDTDEEIIRKEQNADDINITEYTGELVDTEDDAVKTTNAELFSATSNNNSTFIIIAAICGLLVGSAGTYIFTLKKSN
jgi:hypothetical protein